MKHFHRSSCVCQLQLPVRHLLILSFVLLLCGLPRSTAEVKSHWDVSTFADVGTEEALLKTKFLEATEGLRFWRKRRKPPQKILAVTIPVGVFLCIIALTLKAGIAKKREIDLELYAKAVRARKESDVVVARLERLNALSAAATRLAEAVGTHQALRVLAAVKANLEAGEQLRQDLETRRKALTGRDLIRLEVDSSKQIKDSIDSCIRLLRNLSQLAIGQSAQELKCIKKLEHIAHWLHHVEPLLRHIAGADYASALEMVVRHIDGVGRQAFRCAEAAHKRLGTAKLFEDEVDKDVLFFVAEDLSLIKKAAAEARPAVTLVKNATNRIKFTTLRQAQSKELRFKRNLTTLRFYWTQAKAKYEHASAEVQAVLTRIELGFKKTEYLLEQFAQKISLIRSSDDANVIVEAHKSAADVGKEALSLEECMQKLFSDLRGVQSRVDPNLATIGNTLKETTQRAAELVRQDAKEVGEIAAEMTEDILRGFAGTAALLGRDAGQFCKINKTIANRILNAVHQDVEKIRKADATASFLSDNVVHLNAFHYLSRHTTGSLAEAQVASDARSHAEGCRMQFSLLAYLNMDVNAAINDFEVARKVKSIPTDSPQVLKLQELENAFRDATKSVKEATSLQETVVGVLKMRTLLPQLKVFVDDKQRPESALSTHLHKYDEAKYKSQKLSDQLSDSD